MECRTTDWSSAHRVPRPGLVGRGTILCAEISDIPGRMIDPCPTKLGTGRMAR